MLYCNIRFEFDIAEMSLNDHQYTGMVWSPVREWMRSDNNKSHQPLLVLLVSRLLTSHCPQTATASDSLSSPPPLLKNKIALAKQTNPVVSGSSEFYNVQIFIPIPGNLFFVISKYFVHNRIILFLLIYCWRLTELQESVL